jgi:hypothetical protein
MRTLIALIMISGGALSLAAQPASSQESPPPGSIRLPDGFHHERLRGVDSDVGRIAREGGLNIQYDIGGMAGNQAGAIKADDCEWAIKQVVNGEPVEIVKSKDGHITATYTKKFANFYAKVSSEEDLATFLAIVFTFCPAPVAG